MNERKKKNKIKFFHRNLFKSWAFFLKKKHEDFFVFWTFYLMFKIQICLKTFYLTKNKTKKKQKNKLKKRFELETKVSSKANIFLRKTIKNLYAMGLRPDLVVFRANFEILIK